MHRKSSNISFELDDQSHELSVSLTTERLHLESAKPNYQDQYFNVLSSAETMVKFGDGNPWDQTKVNARLTIWTDRWKKNDPFSSLAVFRNDDDQFIGHVVLGHGDEPGQSEMAYAFAKPVWGNGYGKEAVSAVVKEYAPELVSRGYEVDGKPFTSITATARIDNDASVKILKNAGMKIIGESKMYGHNRNTFFIATSDLVKKADQHVVVNAPKYQ